jgi:hypothetical protein
MFQTVPLSIIRSLFTVHSALLYVVQVCRHLSSRTMMENIPVPSVQWMNSWWRAEELPETFRVSYRGKFEKLVHLVLLLLLLWGPVANAAGCTSASTAYCTYPALDVPTFTASRLSRPQPSSDPGSQSRNYVGEKWPLNFAETPTSTKRLVIFYMP